MILFISDTHLGNHRCQAEKLCEFLKSISDNEILYAVGDIIDDHQIKKWPEKHIEALKLLLDFKKIIYIPGNHDYFMKKLYGTWNNPNMLITEETSFEFKGKKYLVVHGDQFDPWVKKTGFISQSWIAKISRWTVDHLHTKIVGFGGYRRRAIAYAKSKGYDGIISGHSHNPEIVENFNNSGLDYINCGSWVENICSAVVANTAGLNLYETGIRKETLLPLLLRNR